MEDKFFENACETLEILVSALGAGLGAWGVINLIEAYEVEAANKEIALDYCHRIDELETTLQQISDDYAADKIPFERYYALCSEYEAEQNEFFEALHGLDAAIAAQKKQAVNQILSAGSLALVASNIALIIRNPDDVKYIFDYVDEKRRASGAITV